MNENEALELLKLKISNILEGEKVSITARKSISRLKHEIVISIIFKHSEKKEKEIIEKIRELLIANPEFTSWESGVDDKFNMEYSAIIVVAEVKS